MRANPGTQFPLPLLATEAPGPCSHAEEFLNRLNGDHIRGKSEALGCLGEFDFKFRRELNRHSQLAIVAPFDFARRGSA